MFTLDVPDAPNQSPPIVMVADTKRAARGTATTERAMGVCYVVANVPEALEKYDAGTFPSQELVYPWRDVSQYFSEFEHRTINIYEGNLGPLDTSSAVIVRPPKHGKLVPAERGEYPAYYYSPDAGYYGNDTAVIQGEVNGLTVKITYYFHALDNQAYTYLNVCGKQGPYWKISSTLSTPALEGLALQSILAAAGIKISVSGADFPGGTEKGDRPQFRVNLHTSPPAGVCRATPSSPDSAEHSTAHHPARQ